MCTLSLKIKNKGKLLSKKHKKQQQQKRSHYQNLVHPEMCHLLGVKCATLRARCLQLEWFSLWPNSFYPMNHLTMRPFLLLESSPLCPPPYLLVCLFWTSTSGGCTGTTGYHCAYLQVSPSLVSLSLLWLALESNTCHVLGAGSKPAQILLHKGVRGPIAIVAAWTWWV